MCPWIAFDTPCVVCLPPPIITDSCPTVNGYTTISNWFFSTTASEPDTETPKADCDLLDDCPGFMTPSPYGPAGAYGASGDIDSWIFNTAFCTYLKIGKTGQSRC
jgi:hypothetical protein